MFNMLRLLFLLALCLFLTEGLLGGEGKTPTANYNVNWSVVNAGGVMNSSSTTYRGYGGVGQTFAGYCYDDETKLYSGFFYPGILFTEVIQLPGSYAPGQFQLSQNYPNPFNPPTAIEYAVPKPAHVTIEIYNILGQKVDVLLDQDQEIGFYRAEWDGKDIYGKHLASGTYFYRIKAGDFEQCKKMLMLK